MRCFEKFAAQIYWSKTFITVVSENDISYFFFLQKHVCPNSGDKKTTKTDKRQKVEELMLVYYLESGCTNKNNSKVCFCISFIE